MQGDCCEFLAVLHACHTIGLLDASGNVIACLSVSLASDGSMAKKTALCLEGARQSSTLTSVGAEELHKIGPGVGHLLQMVLFRSELQSSSVRACSIDAQWKHG